jgi:uncharacterized surface anchored protein
MRQKESLTGEESVRLLKRALEHGCMTVDLAFEGKERHGVADLHNAGLTLYVPTEHFLKAQSPQLEGGQRLWNWEIVFNADEDSIKHLYLLSTQWSEESAELVEERLAKEKIKYSSLMKTIKEEEE